jgi:hypothetical protein
MVKQSNGNAQLRVRFSVMAPVNNKIPSDRDFYLVDRSYECLLIETKAVQTSQ